MIQRKNPFLAIAIAAASDEAILLSNAKCKELMKNDHFFSNAINAIPLDEWNEVMDTADEIKNLGEFKKFAKTGK